jgi:hypothetical protein
MLLVGLNFDPDHSLRLIFHTPGSGLLGFTILALGSSDIITFSPSSCLPGLCVPAPSSPQNPTIDRYMALIRIMLNYFKGFTIDYIERTKYAEAVELAKAAACNTSLPTNVFFSSDIRCIHQDS